jgi:hypothetical protein
MTMENVQLDDFLAAAQKPAPGWVRFGLLENPFPSRSHPIWEVFHNQAEVLRRFYSDLSEFLREGNTTTLFFTGGNRIGKTHFCEYHRKKLPAELIKRGLFVPIAMASAESCKCYELYRPIVDQIDDCVRVQTGHTLFPPAWRERLKQIVDGLRPGDFRQAMNTLATTSDSDFTEMHSLAMQWLRGERVRASQRTLLGVSSIIDSVAHELNALDGLISVLRQLNGAEPNQSPGIILFIDEFELIWTNRRDLRDRFLQALRALVDACPKGLFLCVAMATGIGPEVGDVEGEYPALFARLKGARDIPALVEVPGVVEAQEYARAFLEHGRKKAEQARINSGVTLFTDADIATYFIEVAGPRGGTASQGDFFDRLHTEAEKLANPTPG